MTPAELTKVTADYLARIVDRAPRIHCLTNTVAEPITANALLAIGAVPSLTNAPEEVADFVATAQGLMINLGTPDAGKQQARLAAIEAANSNGLPWLIDPVMVERSPHRLQQAQALIGLGPTALRLNAAERAALDLSSYVGVIAETGQVDLVQGCAGPTYHLTIGDPLLSRITATGCALSAVVTAFLAVGDKEDEVLAALAALCAFGAAGTHACTGAIGPGSAAIALLDHLSRLDEDAISSALKGLDVK